MHWDDLQILRLIDELESDGRTGELITGYALIQAAAQGEPIAWERDARPFARELLLARSAGYLEWNEMRPPGTRAAKPDTEAQHWLQEIRDIRLTLNGRDRARGRLIQRPLPDPEEDDGRPIGALTLEEIAREIGNTYSGSQLPRFMRDSGISGRRLPGEVTGSKWAYVLEVLESLLDGGSAARRELRGFIGGWLEGRLHSAPPAEVQRRIEALLAAQGWHVRGGRLVIGERSPSPAAAPDTDSRVAGLHPAVRAVADRYLGSGHPEVAIFEAFKEINRRVRAMTGLDLDGSKLMAEAFSDSGARLTLADLSTQTGRDVQAGFRFIFMGAVRGIRNPDAHELFEAPDPEEALERLALASMLMRRLDEADGAA